MSGEEDLENIFVIEIDRRHSTGNLPREISSVLSPLPDCFLDEATPEDLHNDHLKRFMI